MQNKPLIALAFSILTALPAIAADQSIVVQVSAGRYQRQNTPVTFGLSKSLATHKHFSLTRISDGAQVPVQRLPDQDHPRIAWVIRQLLKAGQRRAYRLAAAEPARLPSGTVTCRDDGRRLLVSVGDRPVLQYNQAVVESPVGIKPHYRRSGHIHPLYNPAGQAVTDDFPPDHAHQHAVFFPWVNTTYAGHDVNFWDQAGGTGLIEHVRLSGPPTSGPVLAQFTAQLRHSDTTVPERRVAVLDETWLVRVYNIQEFFLVDLESRQQCASDKPLTVRKYHYGGMAIRGSRQWFDAELAGVINKLGKSKRGREELAKVTLPRDYLTSAGKTWIDGNATRARWVEMHGNIDGRHSGMTVMCHPNNFRAPQPVRLHPDKPYFCFAPMALGDFQVKPGQAFVSRYRFYIHNGPPDAATSDRLWNDYAYPPSVQFLAASR